MRFAGMLLGLLASGLAAWAQPAAAASPEGKRYNVLFIVIDDYNANLTSVENRASPVKTPNMERIARRSAWFSNAYNAAPACGPSRTALLTGVEPWRSGVYFNTQPYRRSGTFIAKVDTLSRHFLRNGYLTGAYGKFVHNRFIEDDMSDYTPGYYKMFDRDVINTEAKLEKAAIPETRVKGGSVTINCKVQICAFCGIKLGALANFSYHSSLFDAVPHRCVGFFKQVSIGGEIISTMANL
jgi:hypothetical protein